MCVIFQPHPNKLCPCPAMSWDDADRGGEAGAPTSWMSPLGSLEAKEIRTQINTCAS